MQLWLKSIAGVTEYAMNKPSEDEIWPDTRAVEFELWPMKLRDGLNWEPHGGHCIVEWDLDSLDGAQMKIDAEGSSKDIIGELVLIWKVVETHRTHCPKCWKKFTGSPHFLGPDVNGHKSFHCPADDDWDDRFPR